MTTRSVEPVAARTARGRSRPVAGQGGATDGRGRSAKIEQGVLWVMALGQRGIVVVLAIAVLIAFAAGTIEQRWKEQQLRQQVTEQEAKLQTTEAQNAKLRAQLAQNDPNGYRAWVEATARRQLNLGYAGETIFLVNWQAAAALAPATNAANTAPTTSSASGKQPSAPAAPTTEPHWRKWLHLLLGE